MSYIIVFSTVIVYRMSIRNGRQHRVHSCDLSKALVRVFTSCYLSMTMRFALPIFMAAYVIRQAIIFLPCGLFLSSSSSLFSSPNLSGRRLDVYHTSTHGVALVQI